VEIIEKYGKHLLPVLLGAIALYDRFIVMEMEMEMINKDQTHLEERLDKKIKLINDHEQRLRILECK
jgi:hypothetical protein